MIQQVLVTKALRHSYGIAIFLVIAAPVTAPAASAAAGRGRTFRVGYQTAGWLYYQENGRPAGQVVITLNQAAERAGVPIEWVYTTQDAADAVRSGQVDIWPSLFRTPGREDLYYTRAWGKARHVLFVRNPALMRPEGRAQFTGVVAARRLDHMPNLLARHFPRARIEYFPSSSRAEAALCEGRAEAAVSVEPFAGARNLEPACGDLTWMLLPEADLDIGLATRPGDTEAKLAARRLRWAIAELVRKGELQGTVRAGRGFEADVRSLQQLHDLERQGRWLALASGAMAALLVALAVLAVLVDVQRRRARQALQISQEAVAARAEAAAVTAASEARFRALAESSPAGIFMVDLSGALTYVNRQWHQITGMARETALGSRWTAPVDPEDQAAAEAAWQAARESSSGYGQILRFASPHGRLWVQVQLAPVRDAAGAMAGFVGTATNMTELVQQRASLEDTNQQLLQANRALIQAKNEADAAASFRQQFLATMSHEIRTPLNGILGMVTILEGLVKGAAERDCVRTLAVSGQSLLQIVNDVLDFSKLEAGQFQLRREPFSLLEEMENASAIIYGPATARGNELGSWVEPDVPDWLVGDRNRIRQILVNLAGNAAKFTKNGQIELAARMDGNSWLEISVTDTGVGIPPQMQARLFRPYVQADQAAGESSGTGLGLAICWQLVHLMGGQIGVESEVGRGSRFWFRIPVEVAAHRAPETPLRGQRVWLNLHSPLAQQTLTWQLKRLGATVQRPSAEEKAPESDSAVVGSLGEAQQLQERIRGPIVIIQPATNSGVIPDGSGFRVMTYPVRSASLAVLNPAYHPAAEADPVAAATSAAQPWQKVLVAEDNLVNQKVIRMLLDRLGVEAKIVANGREAIRALHEEDCPIILMDCMMPEMDGWEATRRIREWEAGQPTHWIIALTANAFEDDRERCRQAGMNDFVAKPIELAALQRALHAAEKAVGTLGREKEWCGREDLNLHEIAPASTSS